MCAAEVDESAERSVPENRQRESKSVTAREFR
jgi:hypothetical protein